MKKISLLFISFLIPVAGISQSPGSFEIGFEAGPSLTSLRGNAIVDQYGTARLSGEGALVLQYNIDRIFSVRMTPGLARKGSQEEMTLTDASGFIMGKVFHFTNLDYFTLPLLLRAGLGDNKIRGYVNAGPYMAGLIKSGTGLTIFNNEPGLAAEAREFNAFDFGFSYGIGLQVPLGPRCNFTAEGRQNIGLYNVSYAKVVNKGSLKTNSIVVLIGCAWRIAE